VQELNDRLAEAQAGAEARAAVAEEQATAAAERATKAKAIGTKGAAVATEAAVLQARLAQVQGEVEMRRKRLSTFAEEIEMMQDERPGRTKAALALAAGDATAKWSWGGVTARVDSLQTEVEEMTQVRDSIRAEVAARNKLARSIPVLKAKATVNSIYKILGRNFQDDQAYAGNDIMYAVRQTFKQATAAALQDMEEGQSGATGVATEERRERREKREKKEKKEKKEKGEKKERTEKAEKSEKKEKREKGEKKEKGEKREKKHRRERSSKDHAALAAE
jgi:hypothetical protein